MRIGVLSESRPGERRVALPPDAVTALCAAEDTTVIVQAGAGRHLHATDDDYRAVGAQIADSAESIAAEVDLLTVVNPPEASVITAMRPGSSLLGLLNPFQEHRAMLTARDHGVTTYALELVPRISRAQSVDALSSQALVAGYRAALVGADLLPRFFPLFMTAAGTIPPARVLVLGAGVAGLQAIATARRLGAVVSGYDVRAAAADEVRSLGATFIELNLETQEGTGGYAKSQSADFASRQHAALAPYVADADVVITTAAIPGRTAPLLVTEEMVAKMRPGSVVVDLAAQSGGNCALSKPGETGVFGGVSVWGGADVPSQLPVHASKLYGANISAFVALLKAGDEQDEILSGSRVTQGGRFVHEAVRKALAPDEPEPEPAVKTEPAAQPGPDRTDEPEQGE
ncbi:MAG TPA: NAD(P) transhydrogenase subunit alpha [Actinocrinis sp.]|uniref:NAD(P) transhydrogenase subunit alpha n=1 Tax=Actinocrinis sp. TaxID=1920516 RepID=UPI002DDD1AAD|nr:NAD(P) transhydrogenase subunit alpha [Actinocrinis sp.]HEV2348175.1 NAD(P) transhydrogenase subunit alpha [Actinocrinis sp.]